MTSDEFKMLRKHLRYTQIKLAKLLGRSRVSIAQYESGYTKIPESIAAAIQTLHINPAKKPWTFALLKKDGYVEHSEIPEKGVDPWAQSREIWPDRVGTLFADNKLRIYFVAEI